MQAMAKLLVARSIDESVGQGFDLGPGTSHTVSILLVYVTVAYNVSECTVIKPVEVVP
jgi:hypothetical protein